MTIYEREIIKRGNFEVTGEVLGKSSTFKGGLTFNSWNRLVRPSVCGLVVIWCGGSLEKLLPIKAGCYQAPAEKLLPKQVLPAECLCCQGLNQLSPGGKYIEVKENGRKMSRIEIQYFTPCLMVVPL